MNPRRIGSTLLVIALLPAWAMAQAKPVTLSEDQRSYVLDNGIVTATILKRNGDLYSLQYKGMELLEHNSGHAGAYWSHDTTGGAGHETKVTIDPAANGGERAEVSIKGISGGIAMGFGPGTSGGQGDIPADIEIRYSLGRGESGVYTYCIFDHLAEYPADTMTEARYCAKLASMFDWMSIADSPHHNKHYPATLREGDKYVYTTNQYRNPAFGWSSQEHKVGLFLINPSNEYISGGPTKVEFLGHRDTTQVAAPCVLNYWRSSHYGGAEVSVAQGERWVKVIGPFMLYANSGADPQAIYQDARSQASVQQQKWPYDWVSHSAYPISRDRATVKGRLMLSDPQKPGTKLPNLMVGLTVADYTSSFNNRPVIWQTDAKHYQFWAPGNDDGRFSIRAVRPGTYTLRAFADGVLGELAVANVTVEEGKDLDLGSVTWTPVRHGKQLWEVGIPNRYGSEFFKAETFWEPAAPRAFAELFPDGANFVIGKSDFTKDWYFQHVPHYQAPTPAAPAEEGAAPARGGRGRGGFGFGGPAANGQPAPRTITFDLPAAPRGKAILRLALSGTAAPAIEVAVNQQPAGQVGPLRGDGTIARHGSHGIWAEHQFSFDASLMKQGANVITLTVPGGNVNNGVIYDYLRLELDESAAPVALDQ